MNTGEQTKEDIFNDIAEDTFLEGKKAAAEQGNPNAKTTFEAQAEKEHTSVTSIIGRRAETLSEIGTEAATGIIKSSEVQTFLTSMIDAGKIERMKLLQIIDALPNTTAKSLIQTINKESANITEAMLENITTTDINESYWRILEELLTDTYLQKGNILGEYRYDGDGKRTSLFGNGETTTNKMLYNWVNKGVTPDVNVTNTDKQIKDNISSMLDGVNKAIASGQERVNLLDYMDAEKPLLPEWVIKEMQKSENVSQVPIGVVKSIFGDLGLTLYRDTATNKIVLWSSNKDAQWIKQVLEMAMKDTTEFKNYLLASANSITELNFIYRIKYLDQYLANVIPEYKRIYEKLKLDFKGWDVSKTILLEMQRKETRSMKIL